VKIIDKILEEIEDSITSKQYKRIEDEKIELKNYGHKGTVNWDSVMQSVCAFLNSDNGIIILGVHEDDKNKKYEIRGFNFNHERSLKAALETFKDENGHSIDIFSKIHIEQKELLNEKILVVYVDSLPADEKFVFYKGHAYERIMSADEIISKINIEKQNEYKQELKDLKELQPVINATLKDLDIDKANNYIQLSNAEFKVQNLLTNEDDATSYFSLNGMFRENRPTILGMLVCGNNLAHYLNFRCQTDAYVELVGNLPQNKKIISDNIIPLLEESIRFVYRNIQTGISVEKGGTKTYEYPDELIRECVTNSLAHRDYTIDKYININIVPSKHIEIRNPGRFKKLLLIFEDKNEIPLRRIVTNNAKANNPKLAKVLNVFQKWEGKGRGMKNLVNACLNGEIDLPYYIFHSWDELSLIIPKGQLVDDSFEVILNSYSKYIRKKLNEEDINEEQKQVLAYFYKSELANKSDQWTLLLTKNNNHLNAIRSLEEAGLIYKHSNSDEIHSIYVVDRIFLKKNFHFELIELFGEEFTELKLDIKELLNAIYIHKNYSVNNKLSANLIGNYLYLNKYGKEIELKQFDTFKRKIRNQFNTLEKSKFLIAKKVKTANGNERVDDYELNLELKTHSLFSK
jgi:predicted HTH transcriptional regulator